MKLSSLSLLLCLVMLMSVFVSGQAPSPTPTPANAEKTEKQKDLEKRIVEMLDEATSSVGTLKLAQNRAVVCAMAGDLYWQFDEKRARELFRMAGNDLINANIEAEREKKETESPYAGIFEFGGEARGEILPLIAKHDADLALELLVQTRSPKLVEAMARAAEPNAKSSGDMFDFNPDRYRVQQEIALEQRFALLAAEQNPDKAIKLIKDSLAKGISWNVMPLLQKLHEKDPKKAQSLADDVVAKIVDTDLTKKFEDLQAAIRFLQGSTNPNAPKTVDEKKFKFTEAHLKDIANKIASTLLEQPIPMSLQMTMLMGRVIDDLEKFVPERMPNLRQKQANAVRSMPPEFSRMQQQQKIWNPNSTPEEILANWPKYNEMERASAGMVLVGKIAQIDEDARAKKLIDQIPDEKTRDQAREAYESARIGRASSEGKLDEAKKLISNLTKKKTQIQKLVALAIGYFRKGTDKDKETAAGLMKDAKALTSEFPEDEDELNDLMEIVRGYAVVNPDESFRLFEPVVDQINDFLQASAILSKYNKRNRNFKKGELVMRINGNSSDGLLLFRYIKQMQMLGKADLNRMALLSDRFQRSDARTIVKLFVVQGFLRDDKKTESSDEGTGGMMILDIEG
ncbi:MAG TPA: hypothetical protein VMS29_08815 [Pyrinomonadaceae bacterium]|nr:hypothetical protein [Pyrinomonadaceae bacterium]